MKVLGLVGSVRKLGNTEILTKEALMGAEQEGAEVSILRLTDYDVKACRGCAACLLQERDCIIEDDANALFADHGRERRDHPRRPLLYPGGDRHRQAVDRPGLRLHATG